MVGKEFIKEEFMLVRNFKQMSRMFMTGSDGYPALGNCARAVRFSLGAGDGSKAPFSLRKTAVPVRFGTATEPL